MRWANKIEREHTERDIYYYIGIDIYYFKILLETLSLSHAPSVSPSSL